MARAVLWVIKGLGPGGAERLLAEAARALAADGLALSCAFVVPEKCHLVPDLEALGVDCRCISRRHRDPWWPMRLARLIRGGGFDVVHVHSPLPGSVARLAARSVRRGRRPLVLTTEHNSWATYRLPTRLLNAWTSRWDDHTFAVSQEVALSVKGPAAARLSVLTHGVDVEHVRARLASHDRLRAELGVDPSTVLFGTVANFREQKDYPTLLNACALLVERGVPFRLVAVGQGPLEHEMRALHDSLALGEQATLLGYRADAIDVLAACDVFVLSSRFEGLPVALMEACALGLPVVLTDVGGMRSAIGDDGAEWVPSGNPAALAEAMGRVATQPDLRSRLAAASVAAATQFDGSTSVAELRGWYLRAAPLPAAEPLPPAGVQLRPATAADQPAILQLCRRTLGWDDSGDWEALYRWKHLEGPFGASPAWVAVADGRVVALRVFMRWQFDCDGHVVRAVRAVDTATDPAFRAKGLFTALTLGALPALRADGVALVFNTPNNQSRPGYLKMGWQERGALRPVLRPVGRRSVLRLLRARVPAALWPEALTVGRSVEEWLAADAAVVLGHPTVGGGMSTVVDAGFVRWRFGSSLQPCRVVGADGTVAVVQLRRRGPAAELACLVSWGDPKAIDRLLVASARDAHADVVVRLGSPSLRRGFVGVPAMGPRLACLMLTDQPAPPLVDWHLTMADVALF